jgi:hypothetical protein
VQVSPGLFQRTALALGFETEFQTFGLTDVPVGSSVPLLLARTDGLNVAEVLGRQRVSQSVLLALLVVDAVLDDAVRDVVDGLWHSLELYFSHFDGRHQQLPQHSFEVVLLLTVLPEDQLVHSILYAVDGVDVVLDVDGYLGHLLVDPVQLPVDLSDVLLGVLAFLQDVVVAFVLFQLEGLYY